MSLDNYNTTKETADKLGIANESTIIQYIKLGYIKAERKGNQWLVHQSEIDKRLLGLQNCVPKEWRS